MRFTENCLRCSEVVMELCQSSGVCINSGAGTEDIKIFLTDEKTQSLYDLSIKNKIDMKPPKQSCLKIIENPFIY